MNSSDICAKALSNLRSGVLLLERATGRVTEANPAFLRMCGRSLADVLNLPFWAPPLIDDAGAGAEIFAHLRAGGRVESAELPLQTAHASLLLLELSGCSLDAGTVLLEVSDATARATARVAERMDAQRSLALRVAAEFTELHRALLSAGEALGNCARTGQAAFPESEHILKSADRAGAILRELQACTGQLTPNPTPMQLNELISNLDPALQQLLGPEIEVLRDLGRDLPQVVADPAQVRQILLKLAANSGEAMEHRGKFLIATRNASPDDPALASASNGGSYVILEVADHGPGLDDPSWEHLYEPFFTTRRHGRPGLGLAAVHGIVRQLGGRLWANSVPGKGTTFRIYLPVASPLAHAAPTRPATILLMEPNAGLRAVLASILKKRGYRVLAAPAPADALEMAQIQGPPDLLISEPAPDMLKHLSAQYPALRTLLLNGHSDHAGLPALTKPFELETLLGKVRESLR